MTEPSEVFPLSPARRAEIAARCEKATEGPWKWEQCYELLISDDTTVHWAIRHPNDPERITNANLVLYASWEKVDGVPLDQDRDLAFIAHARQDVPDLLAALAAADRHNDLLTDANAAQLRMMEGLGEKLAAAEQENQRLTMAVRWALGEVGEFRDRGPRDGAFWWRTELRRRAMGLDVATGEILPPPPPEGADAPRSESND